MYHHDFNEKIGFWYVIALAGQSNGMAYGEGIPLPDTLDKPESRVKQLARRQTRVPCKTTGSSKNNHTRRKRV